MMMGSDSKKIASIVLAKSPVGDLSKKNSEAFDKMASMPESEVGEGAMSCCEDMLGAFDRKDPKALAMALKRFLELADEVKDQEMPEEMSEMEG